MAVTTTDQPVACAASGSADDPGRWSIGGVLEEADAVPGEQHLLAEFAVWRPTLRGAIRVVEQLRGR